MADLQQVKDAVALETVEVWAEIDALKAEIQLLKDAIAAMSLDTSISSGTGTLTP